MKPKKGDWIVRMECKVVKEVYCYDCTEEEARENPFDHSREEEEVDQIDWKVKHVEENK